MTDGSHHYFCTSTVFFEFIHQVEKSFTEIGFAILNRPDVCIVLYVN